MTPGNAVNRRKRILIIVVVLLLLFWVSPGEMGGAYINSTPMLFYKTGFYSALDPKVLREVAIITSVKEIGNARLQQAVAEELAKYLVRYIPTKQYRCKVTQYRTIKEAIAAKPTLYLVVRVPKYSYLPTPIFSIWKTRIQIDGARNSDRVRDLEYPDSSTQALSIHNEKFADAIAKNQNGGSFITKERLIPPETRKRHIITKTVNDKYPDGKPNIYTLNDEIFVNDTESGLAIGFFNFSFLTSNAAERAADQVATVLWSGVYEREPIKYPGDLHANR